MEIEFAQPQQSKQALLSISRLKLDVLELPEEVLSLRLCSVRLAPWQAESTSLFGRAAHAGHSQAELIDQFKARLGDGVCSGITDNDDHSPELAWKPTRANAPTQRTQIPRSQIQKRSHFPRQRRCVGHFGCSIRQNRRSAGI